jgi:hypothetical protein
MAKKKHIFKVIFYNEGKLYEIYAQQVTQGNLYGFVEVEQLLFGEKSSVVVDPSEERLKAEFGGVQKTYIPMHAIVRIDEVEKEGAAKITAVAEKNGNVAAFPTPVYTPSSDSRKP